MNLIKINLNFWTKFGVDIFKEKFVANINNQIGVVKVNTYH